MCWGLVKAKPVSTTWRTSAFPSPSVSSRYRTSGASVTSTPFFQRRMPVGIVSLSAKTVRRSGRPSPIGVFKQDDPAQLALGVERIARVFDDVKTTVLVELHGHGAADVGFGKVRLDAEARFNLESLQGVLRTVGRAGTAASA